MTERQRQALRLRYAAARAGLDPLTAGRLRTLAGLVEQHDLITVGMVNEALWPQVSIRAANRNLRRLVAALRRGSVTLTITGPKIAGVRRVVTIWAQPTASEMGC